MTPYDLFKRPEPYAPSPSIWTDPYIAHEMLKAHLDEANDAASYRRERRERVCANLADWLALKPGMSILDVGCGPGLYTAHFARLGLKASGIDFSQNSIDYARQAAAREGIDVRYHCQDYRELFPENGFDAAIMVSEDYGVLSPSDRRTLLGHIRVALKPGGYFAMDVASQHAYDGCEEKALWYALESGFFRPHPHAVTERIWLHPDINALTRTVAVMDDEITIYHIHLTYFTRERICGELTESGFEIVSVLGDLDGSPFDENGKLIGVIAKKA